MKPDRHKPLRDDVRRLGDLLGETLRAREGHAFLERVERVRALAKRARAGDARCFEALERELGDLPIDGAVPVARAFAHFLALANVAEQHHRGRRRRQHDVEPGGPSQRGSCDEAFARLRNAGIAPQALADAVCSMRVELVLTAHPTEILRRTHTQAYNRIAALLAALDRGDLTPGEREHADAGLAREIAILWQTSEVREEQVTPIDEVRAGLVVFEQTLWDAVPRFLRIADRALLAATGQRLPLRATPVTFGSWIGGDRDGNPAVTPEVTRIATWLARWQAADLYLHDIDALRSELSLATASRELQERTDGDREPYRALLRQVRDRLLATLQLADFMVTGSRADRSTSIEAPDGPYTSASELLEPLELCHRSLVATGNELIAAGRLADFLRRVATFGLTLARLDLRQESARHAEAVAWVLQAIGAATYDSASEHDRQRLLLEQLTRPESIRLVDLTFSGAPDTVRDVLETFRMAAELHSESLGAYVITMAARPSDVLAVEFLQQAAGAAHPQRVVPLFETGADLQSAGATLRTLFSIPWYRHRIGGRQEVMVGYSDSAKDTGRFAAAWSLYRAQEEIVGVARDAGVRLTLFHGRGGSVGRGGGPTYVAIQSQPPGSIDGTLRVTEQGEMIQAKFGLPDIALRTLEVYATATLEATLAPSAAATTGWRERMDQLAASARHAYRAIVFEHPRFVEYFRTATPEPELRTIHIGSRPARRPAAGGGVESLRAIPWQFAWTQTRLLLASWLGIEDALGGALARGEGAALREMYEQWAFFRAVIDLMEMVLAKADGRIAALYDRGLVAPDLQELGGDLRARLDRAIDGILAVTGHRTLAESNPVLRRSIDVRNPYVDPINLVQVELLRRLRAADGDDPRLHRAFVVTVNGIAAGMRNTG